MLKKKVLKDPLGLYYNQEKYEDTSIEFGDDWKAYLKQYYPKTESEILGIIRIDNDLILLSEDDDHWKFRCYLDHSDIKTFIKNYENYSSHFVNNPKNNSIKLDYNWRINDQFKCIEEYENGNQIILIAFRNIFYECSITWFPEIYEMFKKVDEILNNE